MRLKCIFGAMLLLLILCQSASALESGPNCVVFTNESTDSTRTLSLPQFDPSLGVLNKVTLNASACASQSFEIDNEDAEEQCYQVTSFATLSTPMPDGSVFILDLPLGYREFCLPEDADGNPDKRDWGGDDYYSFFEKQCIEDEKEFSDPEDLVDWIGSGSVSFTTKAIGRAEVDGPGNFDQSVRTNANETICVTYYYEPCNDNDPCTTDSIIDNKCVYTPIVCDDGNACTTDACVDGLCVYTPITCNDGNACTADSCDPATGCVNTDITATCDDGNACTADSCDPATGCVNTDITATCNDGDACTADSCDPATGCVNTDITATCNDNDACTADSCDPATGCVNTDITATCNDNDACTADSCDPATGCVNTDITATCNDGDACTADSCDPATGCVNEDISDTCDDGDACTAETCDPATGCVYNPIICNDNDACTIESCDPATGCVFTPIDCDDSNACTIDSCDPLTGCTYEVVDCDDRNECTVDICDPVLGCQHEPISCDDGDACTADTCDPVLGCIFTPISCDDSNACTTDSCDPLTGCTYEDVDCDDDNDCSTDSCDPATGCVYAPVNCDDGDACTVDSCDPATGCTYEAVDCDDGDECTADYCDPVTGECVHEYICVTCETAMANWGMDDPNYPDVGTPGHVNDGFLKNARWGWYTVVDRSELLGSGISSDVWAAAGQNDLSKGYRVGTVTISVDNNGYLDWNLVFDGEYSCSDGDTHIYVSNKKNSKNGFGHWFNEPQQISLNPGKVYVAFHDGDVCCNFNSH